MLSANLPLLLLPLTCVVLPAFTMAIAFVSIESEQLS